MEGETQCKCPCVEVNNRNAEVLAVKGRVCLTLISSLWTDGQNKCQLKKFFKSS